MNAVSAIELDFLLITLFGIVGSFVRIIMIRMRDALTGIRMFSIYWISFKQYDSVS